MLGDCSARANAKVPVANGGEGRARYNRAFENPRNRRIMEAEQINLIANTLSGVDDRTAQLRRYL